ncbi:SDR family NAD(P)-dependent oxidoreductase [Patulibacter sp.]|uniref:SDR family NAD(P)-dependent oxidoreductase n=1 Tax=Patulibacter sp. TaxID=1912859 RepID=UPI002724E9FF|nr:SDR family oxidoreductase [Patulibacter sp.]MDO9407476.1 SDR family oxidoreductase [Patulibacter sp.]
MLNIDLTGRTALVTGAAGGIGRGIVAALVEAGATVVAADLVADAAASVAADHPGSVVPLTMDVTDEEGVAAAVASLEGHAELPAPVSLLVNNAGMAGRTGMPFTRLNSSDWELPWKVNVVGPFLVTAALVEQLAETGGSVVNIASVSGRRGFTTSPPYSASKAAILNFTQGMATDLAPRGVRVNAVCPGMVLTPFYRQQRLAAAENDPKLLEITDEEFFQDKASRLIPLGRGQKPADIAGAVAFLASDLASSVTGQALNVDGGLVMS